MHHVQAGVLDPESTGQCFSLLPIEFCGAGATMAVLLS